MAAGHVELVLGPDALSVPATITAGSATVPRPPHLLILFALFTQPQRHLVVRQRPAAGAPVTVAPAAPYGIPCVY